MRHVLLKRFQEDHYVVQLYESRLPLDGHQYDVHGSLKCGWDIVEPEWHSRELQKAMMARKRGASGRFKFANCPNLRRLSKTCLAHSMGQYTRSKEVVGKSLR